MSDLSKRPVIGIIAATDVVVGLIYYNHLVILVFLVYYSRQFAVD